MLGKGQADDEAFAFMCQVMGVMVWTGCKKYKEQSTGERSIEYRVLSFVLSSQMNSL